MISLRIKIRYCNTRVMKLSSYIGWRGVWRNPCLNFRVWSRWSNRVVDLRKNTPWQKMKNLLAGQTNKGGRIKPSRDGEEFKYIP